MVHIGMMFFIPRGERRRHLGAARGGDLPIERDGTILYAAVSGDYRSRVGPREALAGLRA